jgi:DNA-nicking Smr family endonuclease
LKRPPDEEAALFRDSVRDVKRLSVRATPASRKKPPPRARTPNREGRAAERPRDPERPRSPPGEPLSYTRRGLTRAQLRELRRGRQRPQDVLDLHGLTAVRAERALHDFLASAIRRGLGRVRIVHGKGHHSGAEGPVLKTLVEAVLRSEPEVQAFTSAAPRDGGTGAVNVLLRNGLRTEG